MLTYQPRSGVARRPSCRDRGPELVFFNLRLVDVQASGEVLIRGYAFPRQICDLESPSPVIGRRFHGKRVRSPLRQIDMQTDLPLDKAPIRVRVFAVVQGGEITLTVALITP